MSILAAARNILEYFKGSPQRIAGFLVFLLVLVSIPVTVFLVGRRQDLGKKAASGGEEVMTMTKSFFDSNGTLLASEEKRIEVSGPQMLINGEKLEDLVSVSGPVVVDEREEKDALKKYIVELTRKSLGEQNLDLKNRGVNESERARELASQKQTIAQDHQNIKAEITRTLGKKIVAVNPRKGERRIYGEFDTSFNGIALELLSMELDKIKNIKGVKRVVEDGVVRATIDSSVPMVKAPEVWPLVDGKGAPLTGYGVKIGIIDTGVDYTHPDLGGCFGPGCKVEGGWDFINNDSNPMDDHGHGTHVAAIAGGKGVLADGTKLYGVAPDATIYAYKVLDSGGSGLSSGVVAGIDRCVDPNQDGNLTDRLDVCSMSLGGPGNPDDPQSLASDNAMRNGVIITIAAGNSGPGSQTIGSPGTSREAITVGAACKPLDIGTDSACSSAIASFSSRGPVVWTDTTGTQQTISKPDIVAPGVNICAAEWGSYKSDRRCKDDKHIAIAGTSMATPHVAGMAALLRQAVPQATPADIKVAIKTKAIPYSGFDENTQGKGLINTIETLKFLAPNLDFSSNLYSTPFSWPMTTNITSPIYTTTQSFTITNKTTTETTAAISVQNAPAGLVITPDRSSLTIPGNGTATFNATLTADHNVLVSGQTYFANLLLDSPVKKLTIGISTTIPNRLTATKNVDFGIDPPDTSGTWTSTKDIQVTNLQNVAGTYNINADCCYGPNGKVTSGLSVDFSSSSLTLGPNETKTFSTTISIDNTALPNGIYSGTILVSSPLQKALSVPFTATKYYRLIVTFPPLADRTHIIVVHNQNSASANAFVQGTEGSVTFLVSSKYPFLDVVGFLDLPKQGKSFDNILKYVVKEDLPFTGDNTVLLDPATATLEFKSAYTGINGEDIGIGSLVMQLPLLKFKNNGLPAVISNFSWFSPLTYKFNQISSDYVFSVGSYYKYQAGTANEVRKGINFEHVVSDGINTNRTLSNTANDLKLVPVFGYPSGNEPEALFNLNACATGVGTIVACSGIGLANLEIQVENNYRYDLYTLPVTNGLDLAQVMVYQQPEIKNTSGSTLLQGSAMLFDTSGSLRWTNGLMNVGGARPNYLSSVDSQRIDLGVLPYHFTVNWIITPNFKYVGRLGSTTNLVADQEWNSFIANGLRYQVSRDGVVIGGGNVPSGYYGTIDIQGLIGSISGKYDVELYGSIPVSGVSTNHSFKGTFTIPPGFTSGMDAQPPTTTSFDFLSGGIPAQVIDPSRGAHVIKFNLNPLSQGVNLDSITSAGVRMMSDVSGWQALTVTQDPSTKEYSVDVPVVNGANLYTFELTAKDSYNNLLTYTFQLPKGTVPGAGTPSPSNTPTPTPTPGIVPLITPTPTPTISPIKNGTLTGVVSNQITGAKISGVTIMVTFPGVKGKKAEVAKTTTNASGVYFVSLPPSVYNVSAEVKNTYEKQTKETTLQSNLTTTLNFSLLPLTRGKTSGTGFFTPLFDFFGGLFGF